MQHRMAQQIVAFAARQRAREGKSRIKLSSVASNIMGKRGRAILRTLAAGLVRPEALVDRALGSLRSKIPGLILALEGISGVLYKRDSPFIEGFAV
jgi:hypothetical protein